MDVVEAIETRRSIRRYLPRPVGEDQLRSVLDAGRLAPSANNRQHWKFIAVRYPTLREQMVGCCGNQAFVGQAPVLLVVCAGPRHVMTCGQPADTVDASIALSYMQLRAWELGLGTCWLGFFYADRVAALLGVPDGMQVVAVSPLGYPDEHPADRTRKAFGEVACFDRWR